MNERPAGLNIAAELTVEVGGATGTLTGDGRSLIFQTDRPEAFLSALPGAVQSAGSGWSVGRRIVGRLADQLQDEGLTLRICGPRGDLLRLGSAGGSWWGRRLTGSTAVRPGSIRSMTSALWAMVSDSSGVRGAVTTVAKLVRPSSISGRSRRRTH